MGWSHLYWRGLHFAACLMLLCASGCGGGGSGGAEPATVPSLTILSMTPASGSERHSINDPIKLQFSHPVDLVSVTKSSVRVYGGGDLIEGALTVSGDIVQFQPIQPLSWDTRYTVIASPPLTSTSGLQLSAAVSFGFATRPLRWGKPQTFPSATFKYTTDPSVTHSAGLAAVAWRESVGDEVKIAVGLAGAAGATWDSKRVFDGLAGNATPPMIASALGGDIYVAWMQGIEGELLYAARYDGLAAQWNDPVVVAQRQQTGDLNNVKLAVDATGNALIAWEGYASSNYVRAAKFDRLTGAWGSPSVVWSNLNTPRLGHIWFDSLGVARALWSATTDGTEQTWIAVLQPGTNAWIARPVPGLDMRGTFASNASFAADLDGNVYATWWIWGSFIVGNKEIWVARYDISSDKWGGSTKLSDSGDGAGPRVAVGQISGGAVVAWQSMATGARATIGVSRFDMATGTWSPEVELKSSQQNQRTAWVDVPVLGMDSQGNSVVIWVNYGESTVNAARYRVDACTWGAVEDIGRGQIHDVPVLSVDRSGVSSVVWPTMNVYTGYDEITVIPLVPAE